MASLSMGARKIEIFFRRSNKHPFVQARTPFWFSVHRGLSIVRVPRKDSAPTRAGMKFGEYCNGLVPVDAKFGTPHNNLAPWSICFCAPASEGLDGVSDGKVRISVVRYSFFFPNGRSFFFFPSSSIDKYAERISLVEISVSKVAQSDGSSDAEEAGCTPRYKLC